MRKYLPDQVLIFNMLWQLNCHAQRKIVTLLDHHLTQNSNMDKS